MDNNMTHTLAHGDHHDAHAHDHHHSADEMDIFGFWIYILSDCILFASIFAVYAVLYKNTYGGPGIKDFTSLPYVFWETMALLVSSFTYGLSILAMYKNKLKSVIAYLCATFVFGTIFIVMEVNEFLHLIHEGHTWQSSAALSSFFTLVGTHGLHVSFGLLWMLVTIIQLAKFGINPMMRRRLAYLGLFWSFLDVIWIFVFTIVYLMGSI